MTVLGVSRYLIQRSSSNSAHLFATRPATLICNGCGTIRNSSSNDKSKRSKAETENTTKIVAAKKSNSISPIHSRSSRKDAPSKKKQHDDHAPLTNEDTPNMLNRSSKLSSDQFLSNPYQADKTGSYRFTNMMLPTFNASILLDPASFCRKSALSSRNSSISGGDATLRLIRGRKAATKTIQTQLMNKGIRTRKGNDPQQSQPKSFVLMGHGVPHQVLKDHVDLADDILKLYGGAAEARFNNLQGDLNFDRMRIRSRMGDLSALPWPQQVEDVHPDHRASFGECVNRIQLYLTVMTRIATAFGVIVEPAKNGEQLDFSETGSWNWSAEFLRGMAYPVNVIPPTPLAGASRSGISQKGGRRSHLDNSIGPPIVELTERNGDHGQAHVRITLQGTPSPRPRDDRTSRTLSYRRKRNSPMTLVFHASFNRAGAGE
mmetsp:Transcript_15383/g.27942  ORF Transcript_15383/g.27942 Transcript_15383/m.27942 type:complete len:432 (-) Transcript_15383:137-1432(-)|eukprot:CAMPEP_0198290652 /NCGR_PEP_ID=MMETSP1449-20131203/8438_1 /TAXON_ID=420275 /ORGANISM="Attheya septentrionalis, Strain CCMP2084" /LENGTH=431 /DNA_ID=CAMNT_0043989179 /DNA_START=164 /DNA_END=1459 /DNA_ORIENTATION=+